MDGGGGGGGQGLAVVAKTTVVCGLAVVLVWTGAGRCRFRAETPLRLSSAREHSPPPPRVFRTLRRPLSTTLLKYSEWDPSFLSTDAASLTSRSPAGRGLDRCLPAWVPGIQPPPPPPPPYTPAGSVGSPPQPRQGPRFAARWAAPGGLRDCRDSGLHFLPATFRFPLRGSQGGL